MRCSHALPARTSRRRTRVTSRTTRPRRFQTRRPDAPSIRIEPAAPTMSTSFYAAPSPSRMKIVHLQRRYPSSFSLLPHAPRLLSRRRAAIFMLSRRAGRVEPGDSLRGPNIPLTSRVFRFVRQPQRSLQPGVSVSFLSDRSPYARSGSPRYRHPRQ